MKPEFSVIIPTLNEAGSIGATLGVFSDCGESVEIIVADGGSTDATVRIAETYGAKILRSKRGRGTQLQTGGAAANGEILWFVHADTIVSKECFVQMRSALRDVRTVGGNFTIRFDGEQLAAKFLTWLYPQLRLLGLLYGDSAIFTRREVYEKVGGFADYPIFEDLDLVEKLKKQGSLIMLGATVETSSRRFEGKSFILTLTRWTILQILYWCGVSPETLMKIYF